MTADLPDNVLRFQPKPAPVPVTLLELAQAIDATAQGIEAGVESWQRLIVDLAGVAEGVADDPHGVAVAVATLCWAIFDVSTTPPMPSPPKIRCLGPRVSPAAPRVAMVSRPRMTNPIYGSAQWKALVASIIAERGRRCEDCGEVEGRIDADHVDELKDGGDPFDRTRIRLRCRSCHRRKTLARRGERMRKNAL